MCINTKNPILISSCQILKQESLLGLLPHFRAASFLGKMFGVKFLFIYLFCSSLFLITSRRGVLAVLF